MGGGDSRGLKFYLILLLGHGKWDRRLSVICQIVFEFGVGEGNLRVDLDPYSKFQRDGNYTN